MSNTHPEHFATRPVDTTPAHVAGVPVLWTTGDASHALGVSTVSIHKWVRKGKLLPRAATVKRGTRGATKYNLLFDPSDVRAVAREREGLDPEQLELDGAKVLRRVLPFGDGR